MIKSETITINGLALVRTYSDANLMIQQDGTGSVYSEAYDPADSGRTYTETDEEIPTEADSADYKNFQELLQKAVDIQKDWLFYTSEKGRDLHFAKGWYEAMSATGATMLRLHTALDAAEKEAVESLPFDDDSE